MLTIYDTQHPCVPEVVRAAQRALPFGGPKYKVATRPQDAEGIVFFPVRQFRPHIRKNKEDFLALPRGVTTIQDPLQVSVYEDKIAQWDMWHSWMPPAALITDVDEAFEFLRTPSNFPFVSKSTIGSASKNVRILNTVAEATAEVKAVFGDGIEVQGGRQHGYLFWQKFIPHKETWRVTVLGRKVSVYKRFNYPNVSKAAPAKEVGFEPIVALSDAPPGLIKFAFDFFEDADTKYCAIDVVSDGNSWYLLETALSWARSYKPHLVRWMGTKYTFQTQFDLLMDEVAAGVWS